MTMRDENRTTRRTVLRAGLAAIGGTAAAAAQANERMAQDKLAQKVGAVSGHAKGQSEVLDMRELRAAECLQDRRWHDQSRMAGASRSVRSRPETPAPLAARRSCRRQRPRVGGQAT